MKFQGCDPPMTMWARLRMAATVVAVVLPVNFLAHWLIVPWPVIAACNLAAGVMAATEPRR